MLIVVQKKMEVMEPNIHSFKICNAIGLWQTMGKKWTLTILRIMSQEQSMHFSQLKMLIPTISNKVLSERLSELEQEGFIIKTIKNKKHKETQYRLTSLAVELDNILNNMESWIEKWKNTKKIRKTL